MKIKKIFKLIVSVLSISTLTIVLTLPCFCADVSVADSVSFWTSSDWTWASASYGENDFVISRTFTPFVEWGNGFPKNALVTGGYVSSFSSVGILLQTDTATANIGLTSSVNISYHKPLNFVDGSKYAFFIRLDSVSCKYDGQTKEFLPVLNSVKFYDDKLNSYVASVTRSTIPGYSDCYYVLLDGSISFTASRCSIVVGSTVDKVPSSADEYTVLLSLSSMCSYVGDLDYVNVNPALDDVTKQLDDIKNAVGDIKGDTSDTAPGLEGLESEGQAANDALDDLLHGIDVPDGKEHWTKAMELFSDINLLAAFQWWGLCFDYVSAHALLSYLSLFSCLIMLICSVFGLYRSAVFRLNYENKNAEKEVTSTYHSTVRRGNSRIYSTHDRVRVTRYKHGRAVSVRDNIHTDLHKD